MDEPVSEFSLLQQCHKNSRVAAGFGRVSSLWFGCLALKSNDWHHVSHVLILIGGFHFWNIFTPMWGLFHIFDPIQTPPAPTFRCGRVVRSTTSKLQTQQSNVRREVQASSSVKYRQTSDLAGAVRISPKGGEWTWLLLTGRGTRFRHGTVTVGWCERLWYS